METNFFKFQGNIYEGEQAKTLRKNLMALIDQIDAYFYNPELELNFGGEVISIGRAKEIVKTPITNLYKYSICIDYGDIIDTIELGTDTRFYYEEEVQRVLRHLLDQKIPFKTYKVLEKNDLREFEIYVPLKVRLSLTEAESIMGINNIPYYRKDYIETIPQFKEEVEKKALEMIKAEYIKMKDLIDGIKYFANRA